MSQAIEPTGAGRAGAIPTGRVALLIGLVAFVAYLTLPFRQLSEGGDHANWDYMAQVIVAGGAPYRDAVNIKTPLTAYVSAAAIGVGRLLGARDIFAIRVAYLLFAAGLVALVFLLVERATARRFRSLVAAWVAATTWTVPYLGAGGSEPKLLCVGLGLVAHLALARRRYFTAGMALGLSALCWQGGLAYLVLVVPAWIHRPAERRRMAGRGLLGLALPVAGVAVLLAAQGALTDAYEWSIAYGLQFYVPTFASQPRHNAITVLRAMGDLYPERIATILFAIVGAIAASVARVRGERPQGPDAAVLRDGLLVAPVAFLGLSVLNVQGFPDLLPLVPYVAWLAGEALDLGLAGGVPGWSGSARRRLSPRGRWAVGAAVAVVLIVYSVPPAVTPGLGAAELAAQLAAIERLQTLLTPGDEILAVGRADVLVLSGRRNASKYFLINRWGMADMIDHLEPGGLEGWLGRIGERQPKLVFLGRMSESFSERMLRGLGGRYRPGRDFWPYWERVGGPATRS
jgi:hypothetical protein